MVQNKSYIIPVDFPLVNEYSLSFCNYAVQDVICVRCRGGVDGFGVLLYVICGYRLYILWFVNHNLLRGG
jgi:hypothetical protein